MDDLDRKLFHDLSSEIEVPSGCSNVIKESIKGINNKRKKNISFSKIDITSCASLLLGTSIVYAGTKVYEHIFKEPEKIVGFYSEDNKNEILYSENDSIMSEAEAKEKANQILKKFGDTIGEIKTIELTCNPNDYDLIWHIELDNGTNNNNIIEINAERENSFALLFEDRLNENVINYSMAENEVEKTARELCKKYGYDTEKYNKVNIVSNSDTAENSYLWYVDFYKEYDGIINPYETISITFIPEINQIYSFRVEDLQYENNSIEITEEQAKQTVIEAEEKIETNYSIKNISVNLGIEKTNGDAYKRLTDYKQYYDEKHTENYPLENKINYRTESRIRKVFIVTVEYNVQNSTDMLDALELSDKYYMYYIDATTGEIIGGRMSSREYVYK